VIERALAAMRQAAAAAGRLMRAGLGDARQVDHKGRYDLVTDVDRACEQSILEILRPAVPEAAVLAEESAADGDPGGALVWVIDPVDGTTNYTHGYPAFCCSLALRQHGRTLVGLVYNPMLDERFEAVRGQGARCNDTPIRVSRTSQLSQSLLATGFPYDRCERSDTNLDRFAALTMRTRGVRRGGSAALDLCHVACGRLDGYWELGTQPWDVAAGALLVREAGGTLSRTDGAPFDGTGSDTCASNGRLHRALLASLAEPLPPGPCYG